MLQCQKDKFSLPDGLHYLNTAYMSPLPKDTEEEGVRLLKRKNDPSQIKAEDFFNSSNALRKEFGKLVGVTNYQQIAIVPSVSYGIANAANNIELSPHDEIVLTGEQFPSNVYVWMEKAKTSGAKVITVDAPDSIDNRAKKWNERILDAIGDKTKVVTMAHVHWTDGTLFDLEAISKRVKEVGGYLIIDGTQSIGALPFDVGRVKPDALICAGYKWLLGPYGIGLGYYSERFNHGNPIEHSWMTRLESENFAELVNYQDLYQPGAIRYDVGEQSNFITVGMLLESLKAINQWKPENIQSYAQSLTTEYLKELNDLGFKTESPEWRGHHLIGIRFEENIDPKALAERMDQRNIKVSVRGSAVRVAVNVFNTGADLEALNMCLREAI